MAQSNLYPRTYSKEVYQAVGRIIVATNTAEEFTKQLNQAKVLNFTLVGESDPRSLAFMSHLEEVSAPKNAGTEAHTLVMQAAAAEMYKE